MHSFQRKRRLWARINIVVVLVLTMAAQYFFYKFSTDKMNVYPISLGITAGCAIWTTVLLVCMWLRFGWARYILIVMLCLAILFFAGILLLLKSESILPVPTATKAGLLGLVLYVIALIPLSVSQELREFLGPKSAGGH